MEKEEVYPIVKKIYNLDIIRLTKEGYTLRKIAKEIGFSYKSAFRRIDEMRDKGLLLIKREGRKNNIVVNPKYSILVDKELLEYEKTKKQFEKEDNKELTKKLLLQIREHRFTDVDSIKNDADSDKEREYFLKVFDKLKQLGYIKERVEITKRGIKYLAKK
jgi:molybdenum-dependent DNA-binding transcriptional regulator ModE